MKRLALALILMLAANSAFAGCYCTCINGVNQPLCESSIDIPPICPPKVCPIEPPSVKPINPPRVPPIGTRVCYQEYVWDHNLNKYVWKQVCR